jgi:hypothetical protein
MSTEDVDLICEYADMLQVGARNMQNFALLRRLATIKKPILLKRGPSATVKEWLLAAEYLLSGGNDQVVLCERGIKTFETALATPSIWPPSRLPKNSRICRWWRIRRMAPASRASSERYRALPLRLARTELSSRSTPALNARFLMDLSLWIFHSSSV